MTVKKSIYRKHSLSDKLEIIRLYESGHGSTSLGKRFNIDQKLIRSWVFIYRNLGVSGLEKLSPAQTSVEFKQQIVRQVIEKSLSCQIVALRYGVSYSAVKAWVAKVRDGGYSSLASLKNQGRPSKVMKRSYKRKPLAEVEKMEEELRYLRAENAYLKKLRVLVEERIVRESGKPHKPSKD